MTLRQFQRHEVAYRRAESTANVLDINSLKTRLRKVLRDSREDADLSQRQLASALNLTRNQVANIEGGRRAVSVIDLVEIATVLGIAPDRLLGHVLRRETPARGS